MYKAMVANCVSTWKWTVGRLSFPFGFWGLSFGLFLGYLRGDVLVLGGGIRRGMYNSTSRDEKKTGKPIYYKAIHRGSSVPGRFWSGDLKISSTTEMHCSRFEQPQQQSCLFTCFTTPQKDESPEVAEPSNSSLFFWTTWKINMHVFGQ